MDSVLEIYEHCKDKSIDVSKLTVEDVEELYTGKWPFWVILGDLHRKDAAAKNPKPRRKAAPKRQTRDTGRRSKNHRNSAAAAFNSQMAATLELVERVNGNVGEVEEIDNPLQLINTQPGEQFPTFVVIHPEDDDWLTAPLPDTGYERIGPEHSVEEPW